MEWMLMPLRRYADFSGRSRRMEFWMWQVFKCIVGIVIWGIFFAVAGSALLSGDPTAIVAVGGAALIVWLVAMIFGLVIIIPDIAVAVRRLHDTNRSGWWLLAPVVPYLVMVFSAVGAGMMGGKGGMAAGGLVAIIAMIAFLGVCILLLVFYFMEGTRGPNRYGPDPKAPDPGRVFA